MSMCDPCKKTADVITNARKTGVAIEPKHFCAYPESCTCLHRPRTK